MAESREGVRKIDFNLIYLLESGTCRGPKPGLYNCSTIGYNWPKTETPADYLRGITTFPGLALKAKVKEILALLKHQGLIM
jgi:hypothetical protein